MFVGGWDGRVVPYSREVDILSHAFDEICKLSLDI